MTTETCLEVLELSGPVGRRELARAYKRMAMRLHPDHCGNSPEARDAFSRVHEAYERLKLLVESGPDAQAGAARAFEAGPCSICGRLDRLSPGIQGRPACGECLLRRRRLLPLPTYQVIRGAAVITLQVAAAAGACYAMMNDLPWVAAAAGGCAVVSFLAIFGILREVKRFDR